MYGSMLTGRPLKEIEKLAAKDAAEDLDGEEEGILGMNPAAIAWVETAGGNDAVEMRMQSQVLSPSVENAEEADLGSEVLGVDGVPLSLLSRLEAEQDRNWLAGAVCGIPGLLRKRKPCELDRVIDEIASQVRAVACAWRVPHGSPTSEAEFRHIKAELSIGRSARNQKQASKTVAQGSVLSILHWARRFDLVSPCPRCSRFNADRNSTIDPRRDLSATAEAVATFCLF
jgi:hypothetical protein